MSTSFSILLYNYFHVLLFATLGSYVIYQRFLSPLSNIPGPFWASLTRLWLARKVCQNDWHKQDVALHKKYGPIVRIGPDEVSVTDLVALKQIYGSGSGFRKSDFYSVWQGTRKFDLFGGRDEKIHGQHRKLVSRAYSMETFKDLEVYVDKSIGVFDRKMEEYKDGKIDMAKWMQLFAFGMWLTYPSSRGLMLTLTRCDRRNDMVHLDGIYGSKQR